MSSQLWLSFGWQSYIPQNLCRISSSLLCPVCDTIWLVPVRLWQMAKWLGSSAQQLWAELPQTPGPVFETSIQHMKQFAHSWYSHCYQYTDTLSHVSSIQKKYSFEDSIGVRFGLVQFLAWNETDTKPLSEPIMAKFYRTPSNPKQKSLSHMVGERPLTRTESPTLSGLDLMMTSSNGNISRFTGHLCGEFTGRR